MIADDVRLYDVFDDLTGGVDGALSPLLLAQNRAAKMVNATVRGGNVGTRPSYASLQLTFESDNTRALFERFPIQGGKYYWHPLTDGLLISSIGGRIFSTDILGFVKDITPKTGPNSAKLDQVWMEQAEQYFVIQNGQDPAIILEGYDSRRSDPAKVIYRKPGPSDPGGVNGPQVAIPAPEVPTGTVMGFGLNRLVVANQDRTGFKVGDIAGGSTTVLTFSQSLYLNEGPGFTFPRNLGRIVAITFLSQADTAAGIGSCLIVGTRGILAMDLSVPRTDWLDTDISRVVLLEQGGVGAGAVVQSNGDLFFRSQQGGLRSLRMARAQESGWGKTPISREVSNYLTNDSAILLKYCQMARFENRLFCTTAPQFVNGHVNHLGMVVMNFDLISSLSGNIAPAWEGVWTGITPTALTTGLFDEEERMLALCHDQDGINRVYEIRREESFDIQTVPIPAVLHTRAFNFETPYSLKELVGADLWVTDVYGSVDFVLKWRPTGYAEWIEWHKFTVCGDRTQEAACNTETCVVLSQTPRARSRIIMPRPPRTCSQDGSNMELAFGYAFEFRIEWTGRARISRFRAHAHRLVEQSLGGCPADEANVCGSISVCGDDDFSYNLALDQVGCSDAIIYTTNAIADPPETIDFRPWRNAIVRGSTWIIEGTQNMESFPYLKGTITGNRMDNLPESVLAYHTGIRLLTYCSDPYADGDFIPFEPPAFPPGSGSGPSGPI